MLDLKLITRGQQVPKVFVLQILVIEELIEYLAELLLYLERQILIRVQEHSVILDKYAQMLSWSVVVFREPFGLERPVGEEANPIDTVTDLFQEVLVLFKLVLRRFVQSLIVHELHEVLVENGGLVELLVGRYFPVFDYFQILHAVG